MTSKLNEQLRLGTFVTIPSAAFVEGLGPAGLDFVVIDLEHGPLALESELDEICRACQAAGLELWVRFSENAVERVSRFLDQGVTGIVLAGVTDLDALTPMLEAGYFPPLGKRGLSTATRAARYGTVSPATFMEQSNVKVKLVPTIESVEGMRSLDALLQEKRISAIFVGLADLALALGYQGQMDAPQVEEVLESIVRQCNEAQVAVGTIARNLQHAQQLRRLNFQFLILSSTLPWQIYRDTVKGIREG